MHIIDDFDQFCDRVIGDDWADQGSAKDDLQEYGGRGITQYDDVGDDRGKSYNLSLT